MHFGVIGAGVVGLTTALELKKNYPNARVTIIADKFNEKTTSYVAAGIFRPGVSFSGPTESITREWIVNAYNYWDDIRKSDNAKSAGVCQLSGYIFSQIGQSHVKNHWMEKLVPVYRDATLDELNLCGGGWKYGSFFTTILTEPKLFLPFALDKLKSLGGEVREEKLNNIAELSTKYDLIFNCSGLGASDLFCDRKLVPIRGQVIKVRAPWVKMAFYCDVDTYIIPGFEDITLGGCRQYENYNMNLCKYDTASIWERCTKMLPSLKKAEILREEVGLRPHRDTVCVEAEILTSSTGEKIKIVHNYGHGGYGITTGPGTSKYAVKLATDLLSRSGTSKL